MTMAGGAQGYYGLWTVDGVSVLGSTQVSSNDFHVVSVALDANLASRQYLFNDRGSTRTGGGQLAEVIGYNRRLTPQERHDTQAYLLGKWKNLPHPDDTATPALGTVAFADGTSPRLATDETLAADDVTCAGTLEKTGTGTATVRRSTATGFNVREGSLVFENAIGDGAAFHVDAAVIDPADTFTDADGNTRVAVWRDVNGNGMYAKTNAAYAGAPILVKDTWNGRPVLDFGIFRNPTVADSADSASLFWSKSIAVRELFLVLADHDDDHAKSSFFIGTSEDWHRGGDGELFSGFAVDNVENGLLTLNGAVVTKEAKLSDGCNILSVAITNGNAVGASAWVNDRKTVRSGGVLIGEALVYDKALTADERANVIRDLERKWRGRLAATSERATLAAAAGASLTLSNQFVRVTETLAGGGTVAAAYFDVAGTLRAGDAATAAATLTLAAPTYGVAFAEGAEIEIDVTEEGDWDKVVVNGPATFAGGGTVKVNLPSALKLKRGFSMPILTATSVTAATPGAWRVTGSLAERYSARVDFDATTVSVRLVRTGTMITIR